MNKKETTKQKVIRLYEIKYEVHPSYSEIAQEVGVSKSRVAYLVQNYLSKKSSHHGAKSKQIG